MNPQPLSAILSPGTDPAIAALYESLVARSRDTSFGFEPEVVILDLETTGLTPRRGGIIEIAMARMRGAEVVDRYSSLVDPGTPVPDMITEITGITSDMLATAPRFDDIADDIRAFIGDADIVAHNARFDRAFTVAVLPDLANRWVDSIYLARIALPRLSTYRLVRLAEVFAPETAQSAHRALDDVLALAAVWRIVLCGLEALDPAVLGRIADIAQIRNGDEAGWIRQVLGASAAGEAAPSLDLRDLRRRSVREEQAAEALADAWESELTFSYGDTIAAELGGGGTAGAMHPLFEERPEQQHMAADVYRAFAEGHNLAVEAGTGVGKSLAYLIPGASVALENGVAVGIATKTNALTDQLMSEELPRLAAAHGGALRYSAVKGYGNYLCMRKVASLVRDPANAVGVEPVLAWIAQSPSGDVDAMSPAILRGGLFSLRVRATQVECTKRRCPYYPNLCYIHGARKRAMSSHIVVTNHALLFRDAVTDGQILPPVRFWVVDEAHSAEKSAREQLAERALAVNVSSDLDLAMTGRRSPIPRMRTSPAAAGDAAVALFDRMAHLRDNASTLAESFFSFTGEFADSVRARRGDVRGTSRGGRSSAGDYLWVGPADRDTSEWGFVARTGSKLQDALLELVSTTLDVVELFREADGPDADAALELKGTAFRLAEEGRVIGRFVAPPEANAVYSVRAYTDNWSPDAADQGASIAASIELLIEEDEVGPTLAQSLYGRTSSVVFTSATLAAGDDFAHFMSSVGLVPDGDGRDEPTHPAPPAAAPVAHHDAPAYEEPGARYYVEYDESAEYEWSPDDDDPLLARGAASSEVATRLHTALDPLAGTNVARSSRLGSSYDLEHQMSIYIVSDMPQPNEPGYLAALNEALREIHLATDGGVLTLFTNEQDMRRSFGELKPVLAEHSIDLISQRAGASAAALRESFASDMRRSMFAVKKFWEGFDVRGDTLRCVVIPKMPFQPPTSPLSEARRLRDKSSWWHYDLPEATIELRQAIGRLIRSATDTGVVIIADSRLAHSRYAKRVQRALPVPPKVMTLAEIVAEVHGRFGA